MLGDVLEWLGGAAFVGAAYHWLGLSLALAVAGVFCFYEAQCYSDRKVPRFKRRPKNEGA